MVRFQLAKPGKLEGFLDRVIGNSDKLGVDGIPDAMANGIPGSHVIEPLFSTEFDVQVPQRDIYDKSCWPIATPASS